MRNLLFLSIFFFIISCAPKITTNVQKTYEPYPVQTEILVLGINDEVPVGVIEVGTIKIGDSGFSTDCGWNKVIEKAKVETRAAGGNVLKITEHTPPSALGSSCDRIKARLLRVESEETYAAIKNKINPPPHPDGDYALLYVYRPSGSGMLISYDLHLGDSTIGRIKNNNAFVVKITKKGLNKLWAKTEAMEEIPIDIEFGREYFLRSSLVMGIMVGRPLLQFVDRTIGKAEYDKIYKE